MPQDTHEVVNLQKEKVLEIISKFTPVTGMQTEASAILLPTAETHEEELEHLRDFFLTQAAGYALEEQKNTIRQLELDNGFRSLDSHYQILMNLFYNRIYGLRGGKIINAFTERDLRETEAQNTILRVLRSYHLAVFAKQYDDATGLYLERTADQLFRYDTNSGEAPSPEAEWEDFNVLIDTLETGLHCYQDGIEVISPTRLKDSLASIYAITFLLNGQEPEQLNQSSKD